MHRAAVGLALLAALAAQAQTTKVSVNGMVCAFCAQGIEKRLVALPQTKSVYVSLERKLVAVEAREGQAIDESTLRREITEAGYDVVAIEASSQSVAEIRAATAKKR